VSDPPDASGPNAAGPDASGPDAPGADADRSGGRGSGRAWLDGPRLALTTFTVAPIRAGRIDRTVAGVAMSLAPAAGAILGAAVAGAGIGTRALGGSPLLAAVVAVALGVLLTRALHLDGLADTIDGLGSYRDAAGTLAIMKKPDVGPFGVTAIMLVLLAQVASLGTLLARPWPEALVGTVSALAAGRLAVAFACRRSVAAARPDGLGALVAGTVGWPALLVGTSAVGLLAILATPAHRWHGPVAVGLALAVAVLFTRHVVRRMGGITGDVLGAEVELTTTTALITLAL
jgi:adenosylcobinamide-GDP ribazoletransferase